MKTKSYPVKISSQGQITLPKELRQKLGAIKGQTVYIGMKNQSSLQVDATPPIAKFRGALAPAPGQPSAADIVQEIREKQREKLGS
jgi:AbrB family looped-hinge helix DNA binding protein